jgi:hypothetical protein
MSTSPEPPERLAEILLEILALSKPERSSESDSEPRSDPSEFFDPQCVKKQLERADEEGNNRQKP